MIMQTRVFYALPKLPREEAAKLLAEYKRGKTWFSKDKFNSYYASPEAFPTSSGKQLTKDELLDFRKACLEAQSKASQKAKRAKRFRSLFDLYVGWEIFELGRKLNLDANFGDPAVWDFLTLALLPDVVASRFDPKEAGVDRFTGGNRRHVLQRLWRRWKVLDVAVVQEDKLTEDDYVQILERSTLAQNPTLAGLFASKLMSLNLPPGQARRDLTRNFAKRVEALSGVVVLSSIDKNTLEAAVNYAFQQALSNLEETKKSSQPSRLRDV